MTAAHPASAPPAWLGKATDIDAVRGAIDAYGDYRGLLSEMGFDEEKSLEDQFFELEVNLNRLAFEQQFHYGMYYAYVKLKEQEIRNIVREARQHALHARPSPPPFRDAHRHPRHLARPLVFPGVDRRVHLAGPAQPHQPVY